MKTFRKIFIISFLLLILMYTCNITSIPENVILFQGEHYNVRTLLGLSLTQKKKIMRQFKHQVVYYKILKK